MCAYAEDQSLRGKEFRDASLVGASFVECDLTDVVIRGSEISGMEVDAPWLRFGKPLIVNGLDVGPLVEADLNRRFPGRELQEATDPEGLRAANAALESAWTALIDRAAAMPEGTVDRSVAGEWSFAQTLRHVVLATDKWVGRMLGTERHPLGLNHAERDSGPPPPYDDVLAASADRRNRVRDYLASVTPEVLDERVPHPNDPENPEESESIRSCFHVILEEGWEHLRFATRDLDLIDAADHQETNR
jgi:uncharacterized damage-inducible protein DinB